MHDEFTRKVHAAAVAGWWTLLAAVIFLSAVWFAYLGFVNSQPGWVTAVWGPGVTWELIETVAIWSIAIFKVALYLLAVLVLWLTLWARQLKKSSA